MKKKSQTISISVIVVSVITLLLLMIVIAILTGNINLNKGDRFKIVSIDTQNQLTEELNTLKDIDFIILTSLKSLNNFELLCQGLDDFNCIMFQPKNGIHDGIMYRKEIKPSWDEFVNDNRWQHQPTKFKFKINNETYEIYSVKIMNDTELVNLMNEIKIKNAIIMGEVNSTIPPSTFGDWIVSKNEGCIEKQIWLRASNSMENVLAGVSCVFQNINSEAIWIYTEVK